MYETELNLRDEDRITKRVADQYGGTFRKVTLPYRIDGVLEEDGRIIAFLEAKRGRIQRQETHQPHKFIKSVVCK
jgi:hypothetical protein